MEIHPRSGRAETYSMEPFVADEFRAGRRENVLEVSLHAKEPDVFYQRDVMSFLMTVLQHFFPEYECRGKLV